MNTSVESPSVNQSVPTFVDGNTGSLIGGYHNYLQKLVAETVCRRNIHYPPVLAYNFKDLLSSRATF